MCMHKLVKLLEKRTVAFDEDSVGIVLFSTL